MGDRTRKGSDVPIQVAPVIEPKYWLCCGETSSFHNSGVCHETKGDQLERLRYGTSAEHQAWERIYGQQPIENGGIKHDTGKPRFELLAPEALAGTARILTFGAAKYSDRNWEKGMKWSRVFGALMRHLWAWWRGENCDVETGESHLHHAACCLMFLQTYEARKLGEDDRAVSLK